MEILLDSKGDILFPSCSSMYLDVYMGFGLSKCPGSYLSTG